MLSRRSSGRVTLADVAKMAGVSPMTVSRTIRGEGAVSDAIRKRVFDAVEELDYIPDVSARKLASRAEKMVYMIGRPNLISAYSESVVAAEVTLRLANVRLQVSYISSDPELEYSKVIEALGSTPLGIILVDEPQEARTRKLLAKARCPVIYLMDIPSNAADLVVGLDHVEVGHAATRHLLERRYSRIAFLAPAPDWRVLARIDGYKSAMHEARLSDRIVVKAASQPSGAKVGSALLRELLDEHPEIEAVCCYDDEIALGAVFEGHRRGLDMPERLGISGFGNIEVAAACEPPVTTVAPNFELMGAQAGDLLLRAKRQLHVEKTINVGFEMIERASTQRDAVTVRNVC